MGSIIAAAVQMSCSRDVNENISKAETLTRKAAAQGANIVLLPELFERQYFCQERRYDYYDFAKPVDKNDAVIHFSALAKELGIVMPISFYERDKNMLYNSIAVADADGSILGVYRKTHIPDDHYYQEKFYFTSGNSGFKVWDTAFGRVGTGICWDQWFPEAARIMTLMGAQMLVYPTAIGSEPILGGDSMPRWQRVMQGHSAANVIPVIAANRHGLEEVTPCEDNGGQSSALDFYGSSFITDETGRITAQASRNEDEVICAKLDLDACDKARLDWGVFRDRQPHSYTRLTEY